MKIGWRPELSWALFPSRSRKWDRLRIPGMKSPFHILKQANLFTDMNHLIFLGMNNLDSTNDRFQCHHTCLDLSILSLYEKALALLTCFFKNIFSRLEKAHFFTGNQLRRKEVGISMPCKALATKIKMLKMLLTRSVTQFHSSTKPVYV